MRAGRELDALVARKVMGWEEISVGSGVDGGAVGRMPGGHWKGSLIPKYSTDIAAAWEVVKKLGTPFRLETGATDWLAMFMGTDNQWPARWTAGESAPLAICLAALAAGEGCPSAQVTDSARR